MASPVYMVKQNTNNVVQSYPAPYDPSTDSFNITYGAPASLPAAFPPCPIPTAYVPHLNPHPRPPTTGTTHHDDHRCGCRRHRAATVTGWSATTAGFSPSATPTSTAPRATWSPASATRSSAWRWSRASHPRPTTAGYWLVTVNGGVFPFGNADYYGSLPAIGVLDAEVVAIVPTADGKGYFMVSWQGGVYAFGDARFEGSCGTIGGCGAPLTGLVPDATGNGYWLLLSNCQMVAFGDAPKIPASDCLSYATANKVQARTAARTPDGRGYWVLLINGSVYPEGDAVSLGSWKAVAAPPARTRPRRSCPPVTAGGPGWSSRRAASTPTATPPGSATWPVRSFRSRSCPPPVGSGWRPVAGHQGPATTSSPALTALSSVSSMRTGCSPRPDSIDAAMAAL